MANKCPKILDALLLTLLTQSSGPGLVAIDCESYFFLILDKEYIVMMANMRQMTIASIPVPVWKPTASKTAAPDREPT